MVPSRFGLLRVRSPLLTESLLFSFPPGNEMFQFPGLAPAHWRRWHGRPCRVAPFGNPRIGGYLLLPAAYRSLSRPSSPPAAKASFMCPCLLSLVLFCCIVVVPDVMKYMASAPICFCFCSFFLLPGMILNASRRFQYVNVLPAESVTLCGE